MKTGHLHPLTLIQRDLEDIFKSLGFSILEGPELESDYYNFEALNIDKHHPARDMQDTFYVDWDKNNKEEKLVMRTHTSPVQIRAMQTYGAPLKAIVPGRVFRNEAMDASHEHTFYQLEGLMIDKDISITNMIALMKELLKGIFEKEVPVRIRPGFFPFVEPGIELDISCQICDGKGCSVCKQSGWLELFPAGMVHPNVLKAGGIDSKKYSGFAFGLGLTRLVMMKYRINDIRLFNSGDLRFLEQF
jgi:phenylalanyl-tRNA synthetase alpha chain